MRILKFIFVIGFVFLLTNCEKEKPYELQKYGFQLNYIFENFTDFDTIPVQIPIDDHADFGFSIKYIDINDDDDDDFYVSEVYYAINDFLISKSFSISHEILSDDHFEIAILEDDYLLIDDSIKIAAVLNKTDEINSHPKWSQLDDKDSRILFSCYYDYDNYMYILNEDTPINGTNLNINGDIDSKFIGVRKKIDNQYFYGWIQFTIENHERLTFEQFSFYK